MKRHSVRRGWVQRREGRPWGVRSQGGPVTVSRGAGACEVQVEQVWAKTQSSSNSSFRVSDMLGALSMPWFPLLNTEPVFFLGICGLWSVSGGVSSVLWQGQVFRSFLKNLFIFNWRIIALQYCIGFYQTSSWISPLLLNWFRRKQCLKQNKVL